MANQVIGMKRVGSPKVFSWGALALIFVLGVYPIISLFIKGLGFDSTTAGPSFFKVIAGQSSLQALKNTLLVGLCIVVVSTLLATPLAYLLTRTDVLGKKVWRSLFCLPYAIPPYIGAIAWIYLANPSNGLINLVWGSSILNIYHFAGLVWVISCFYYTFILLALLPALDQMDPSLEEACRLSGAGPLTVFWKITLPMIWPNLLSGMILVFLGSIASFGVPALIGGPAGIYLMTTKIYTYLKMGSLSGMKYAIPLGIELLIMVAGVLFINHLVARKESLGLVKGKTSRASVQHLGPWRWPTFILLASVFFVLFGLPILGILVTALSKVQGVLNWNNFGFQNFYKIFFETEETLRALSNSAILSIIAGVISLFIGFILAFIRVKTKFKGNSWIDGMAHIPYSTPGTLLALGMILAFGHSILGVNIVLYNTLGLIAIAYIAKYYTFAYRTIQDGMRQVDNSLLEAASMCQANFFKSIWYILLPILRPTMMASFFLVFMPCFSELTMTVLLTGPGLETVGTLLFQLQEYGDASGGGGAVLALILVALVSGLNFLVKIISKGKYGL